MLTIINLYTIDKIFNEDALISLSSGAKMLYINCITHHFRDKKPTVLNAVAFDIFISEIKNYQKFTALFEELYKANLITMEAGLVHFNNMWGKHIDRTKLDKITPTEALAGYSTDLASKHKADMLNHGSLFELSQMKYKISKYQLEKLIDLFVKEQDTFEKRYINMQDCVKHFTYWIPNNLSKTAPEQGKSTRAFLGE